MIVRPSLCKAVPPARIPITSRRWQSTSWMAQRLREPVQSYISTCRDPYLNLSIEHHLLQKTPPDSAILFLYTNRPSIIIGRNQNPWLEVNLALLNPSNATPAVIQHIDLVRRRSGGGTVFHDEGNVNWTVICPSGHFTRDKHAEMVVRALRASGVVRARVNERHDIVLDQGERGAASDPDDTHVTPYTSAIAKPLKVSGSAYKLTRGRALHHGTCLLSSPNLGLIPRYLRSPAKAYIKARGVESVSSPVANVGLGSEEFNLAVQEQFGKMYAANTGTDVVTMGEQMLEVDDVKKGCDELRSLEWKYLSTPQFTISNHADATRPVDIELTTRHGVITGVHVGSQSSPGAGNMSSPFENALLDQQLHNITSWRTHFGPEFAQGHNTNDDRAYVVEWLDKMLPAVPA